MARVQDFQLRKKHEPEDSSQQSATSQPTSLVCTCKEHSRRRTTVPSFAACRFVVHSYRSMELTVSVGEKKFDGDKNGQNRECRTRQNMVGVPDMSYYSLFDPVLPESPSSVDIRRRSKPEYKIKRPIQHRLLNTTEMNRSVNNMHCVQCSIQHHKYNYIPNESNRYQ